MQRQLSREQWKCFRFSSPELGGHFRLQQRRALFQRVMAAMNGFLVVFSAFFALLRVIPELSAGEPSMTKSSSLSRARGWRGRRELTPRCSATHCTINRPHINNDNDNDNNNNNNNTRRQRQRDREECRERKREKRR